MSGPTLLEKVKTSMRVMSTAFDELEIEPLIEAAKHDLRRSGIDYHTHEDRELCELAIVIYVKLYFGAGAQDSVRLTAAYEKLKSFLSAGERNDADGT